MQKTILAGISRVAWHLPERDQPFDDHDHTLLFDGEPGGHKFHEQMHIGMPRTLAFAQDKARLLRKDLAVRFKGQYPVSTYVGEVLLVLCCASAYETEIAEGLKIVERQLREPAVRPCE